MEKKYLTREESKKIMVDILDDVANFCDTHNLRYTLSSGTLIGAIRHKGFIPWDDDIDIDMPRPDYEKFIELYRKEGKYSLTVPGDKDCFLLYMKVYDPNTVKYEDGIDYDRYSPLGIDIDIFPLDGLSDDFEEHKKQIDGIRKIYHDLGVYTRPRFKNSLKSTVAELAYSLLPGNYFALKAQKLMKTYDYETSGHRGFLSFFDNEKYMLYHRAEVFSSRVKVTFEGKEYWAPAGYDEYLTDIYGDYMTPPPVDEQQSPHGYKAFWKV